MPPALTCPDRGGGGLRSLAFSPAGGSRQINPPRHSPSPLPRIAPRSDVGVIGKGVGPYIGRRVLSLRFMLFSQPARSKLGGQQGGEHKVMLARDHLPPRPVSLPPLFFLAAPNTVAPKPCTLLPYPGNFAEVACCGRIGQTGVGCVGYGEWTADCAWPRGGGAHTCNGHHVSTRPSAQAQRHYESTLLLRDPALRWDVASGSGKKGLCGP